MCLGVNVHGCFKTVEAMTRLGEDDGSWFEFEPACVGTI
jgi:hypothetical protein